mmetsp:Transcript_7119/g.20907  ORF Transcript_7119/g.20907 Transcript_7119/m.20907 type:complete len:452 (+) Transcript_7119:962-2317(+)
MVVSTSGQSSGVSLIWVSPGRSQQSYSLYALLTAEQFVPIGLGTIGLTANELRTARESMTANARAIIEAGGTCRCVCERGGYYSHARRSGASLAGDASLAWWRLTRGSAGLGCEASAVRSARSELPPGAADRGWGAQWTAMHKSVSEVAFVDGPFREAMARGQPRIQTPRGDVIMKGQKGDSLRQFRAAPDGGPDLDKPRMEHILGGSAQERVVEFLQQHERQARREAAGAESPASRPSASSSALAVILALLLVAVVSGWRAWRQRRAPRRQRGKQPAERAFRERARRRAEAKATAAAAAAESAAAEQAEADGGEGEGQQTGGSPDWVTVQHLPQTSTAEGWRAREPLSDPDMSDGASEAGLAHGGRPTPSAPPDPEILSLAAATFDTGRRDAPESTIGGETTCIVCFTRPKTHAALPCGHQCVCAPCSARLRACPYCRTPAERWWHVRVV